MLSTENKWANNKFILNTICYFLKVTCPRRRQSSPQVHWM